MKPIVAIVGRPNVGKSTLFNRMTRTRKALVDDFPGVTRDRIYGDVSWDETAFTVVDTGGFCEGDSEDLGPLVRRQVEQAVEEADAVVMVLDGRQGLMPGDRDLVQRLRRSSKPVFYGVNKIDGPGQEVGLADFAAMGVEPLYPVSAEHGYGMVDFMDALATALPRSAAEPREDQIRIAVVGQPNVGKSSLINQILGDDRLLVSEIPGTTRDAVDTLCTVKGRQYVLIDTAGIRRKNKVQKKLEKFSVLKALQSLNRCHVALLMLDASAGIVDQDVRIAGYVWERMRGCVILINKWDLVEKEAGAHRRYVEAVRDRMKFLGFAPILTVSALTGQRTVKVFEAVEAVHGQYTSRIGTGALNRTLERILLKHQPPSHRGRPVRLFYCTQTSVAPPTIVCFVNHPEGIPKSYHRYVTSRLRESLGLSNTPIRLIFRKRESSDARRREHESLRSHR